MCSDSLIHDICVSEVICWVLRRPTCATLVTTTHWTRMTFARTPHRLERLVRVGRCPTSDKPTLKAVQCHCFMKCNIISWFVLFVLLEGTVWRTILWKQLANPKPLGLRCFSGFGSDALLHPFSAPDLGLALESRHMPLPIFYCQGGGGNLDRILEKRKEKLLMMEEKRNEQVWLGIATNGDGLDWAGFSVKSLRVRGKPFARLFNTYGWVHNKTSQHTWFGSALQGVDRMLIECW